MASKVKEWEEIDKPSPCWKHFVRNKNVLKEIKCKICSKTFSNPTNDTCRYHVLNVHAIKVPKAREQAAINKASSSSLANQPSIIASLTPKDSLSLVLARMASVDKLSFRTIATSVDIREGLRARGFKVVKSPHTVRAYVVSFAEEIKLKTREKFEVRRACEKFSITLDEYTSINNKR